MFEQDKLRPLPNDHFNNHDGDALQAKDNICCPILPAEHGSLPQEDAGQGGKRRNKNQ